MIEVSVIMPCHNGQKYIAESILSVINQSYKNWELLVVNDNSSDNSVKIISDFVQIDNRIKLLHTINRTGMPATPRNIGISEAKGRFIAFLDCDDFWLPSKLEIQLKMFEQKNVAVVYSNYYKLKSSKTFRIPIIAREKGNYNNLLMSNFIGNLTGIYDTNKVGKIYQKEIHHEDYYMWLNILDKNLSAINTNTFEACYRTYDKSISSNKIQVLSWQWNIYKRELKLPIIKCIYYFCCYSIKGLIKHLN